MDTDKIKKAIVVVVAWTMVLGLLYICYLKLKILFH
jgi:hypothetical protein